MECRHIRSKFAGYADGDLYPQERRLVERHTADCDECRMELEAMSGFLNDCHEFLVCPEPSYSFERLRARMATVQPLDEVVAFLPKLRVHGAFPRFAVAALFLLFVGSGPLTARGGRQFVSLMKSPFSLRTAQLKEDYLDRLDAEYRAKVTRHGAADDGEEPWRA